MNEDRNQHQIIRKDARNCFVESLNDDGRQTTSIFTLQWTSFWN